MRRASLPKMLFDSYSSELRQAFAKQFEEDGTGFLYRRYMKGPAIRVTEAEREEFISVYQRRIRHAFWAIIPATLLLIGALVWLFPSPDDPASDAAIWAGLAAILIPFLAAFFWAWNAPARELSGRTPSQEARSREEVRKIAFSQITWVRLGSALILAVLLLFNASTQQDILHGPGLFWLTCSVSVMIGVAIQAFRKWMFERD